MDIHLHQDSIVNQRSGVVEAPSEYVENLRALEVSIQRFDDDIAQFKAELKTAREGREKAVAALRSAIREGKVLPLLEAPDETEDTDETA